MILFLCDENQKNNLTLRMTEILPSTYEVGFYRWNLCAFETEVVRSNISSKLDISKLVFFLGDNKA